MHDNKTPTTLRSLPEHSKRSITETTQNEMSNFYKTISEAETKPYSYIVSDTRLQ